MIVLEVIFLVVFWSWALTAALFLYNTFLPRMPVLVQPQTLQLPAETVRFGTADGYQLEGWKIAAAPERPWILLCHGLGSNRANLLDIAAGLYRARLNLLLFDFRAHGSSAGRMTSFGWREQRDLEGALAFLGQQPDVPAAPYGIFGISMGGAVALLVAARDERLGAVALDSPYTNLQDAFARQLALLYPLLPCVPFLWFLLATYRMRFGVWPRHVSPHTAVAALHPRPLLLIQGGQDARTPPEDTRRLYAAAGDPKDLLMVEGAGHLEAYAVDPHIYLRRLVHFFEASLTKS